MDFEHVHFILNFTESFSYLCFKLSIAAVNILYASESVFSPSDDVAVSLLLFATFFFDTSLSDESEPLEDRFCRPGSAHAFAT